MSNNEKPKTAKEIAQSILKSVGQENHPIKELIELALSKWESQIRFDQLKKDHKKAQKIISKTFSENKNL
jgi:uncharacterized membrane protein YkoI